MTDFRVARPWRSRRDSEKQRGRCGGRVRDGLGPRRAADPPLEFDGSKFLLKAAEPNRRRPGSREPFTTAILFGAALATAA